MPTLVAVPALRDGQMGALCAGGPVPSRPDGGRRAGEAPVSTPGLTPEAVAAALTKADFPDAGDPGTGGGFVVTEPAGMPGRLRITWRGAPRPGYYDAAWELGECAYALRLAGYEVGYRALAEGDHLIVQAGQGADGC